MNLLTDMVNLVNQYIVVELVDDVWDNFIIMHRTNRGAAADWWLKVQDSKASGYEFNTHTGHDSLLKLRQFNLPQFTSAYSATNEHQHCWYL